MRNETKNISGKRFDVKSKSVDNLNYFTFFKFIYLTDFPLMMIC